MASNTENLNLLMKNPSTDGADTFNVQTMLNENWQKIDNNAGTVAQTLANILKPTTPPIIGLPPSTTPDGMFQALGNTGELHVWRKTVVNASEKPAGYTLGSGTNLTLVKSTQRYGQGSTYWVPAASISVNDGGAINEITGSSVQVYYEKEESELKSAFWGKFIKFSRESDYGNVPDKDGVWFIPSSATIQKTTGGNYYYLTVVGAQKVNPYPLTPAGTTTTYPVSTNPNAYQEGDDAKPAGYTLGEVVTGSFRMSDTAPRNAYLYKYANSVAVKENGEVVLQNPEAVNFNSDSHIGYESTVLSLVAGKFLYYYGRDSMAADSSAPDTQPPFNATPSEIVYVPADAAITATNTYPAGFYLDKYQPVTGYAAIPAGTTIEYLGKLGDKARVQVVSYVGTGTYGKNNPNSLTFDFVPKVILIYRPPKNRDDFYHICMFLFNGVNTGITLAYGTGFNNVTWNNKKVSWYSSDGASENQMSVSGQKYYAAAIG